MAERSITIGGDGQQQIAVGYGDGVWADVDNVDDVGYIDRVVLLPMGTIKGNASVEVLIKTRAGLYVHANTTYALWDTATEIMRAWRKDPTK